MYKKNYLTGTEQNIWQYINDKEMLDNELISQIFPEMSENKRNKTLHSLYKKGYLKRARKDLYYNPEKLNSFYKLALKIREGYIGLSSALRYYNLIEYEDYTIFIMTKSYQKKMPLKGTQYQLCYIPLKEFFTGFEKKENIQISSVEKTLFDCFLKPSYIGFTNIAKVLYDAKMDWKRFMEFFKLTNNNSLCQRTGYILDMMKKETKLAVPDFVFKMLLKHVQNPVKLMSLNTKSVFNKKWKIQDNLGKEKILSWWY